MDIFRPGFGRQRTWAAVAIGGGAALSVGGAITSATAGGPKISNTFLQNPEYPHSQDARDLWWNKLQSWGSDPNYGAIAPDWNSIWDQTQKKVKQYYEGGPMAPGVQDRVNSSLARRGMSEQPASDFLHAQVGAQESDTLGGLSAEQNIAQNQFANQGRTDWLNSLNSFQAQKPAGQWQTTSSPNKQAQIGDMLGKVGGAVGSLGAGIQGGDANTSYLDSLLSGSPTSYTPSNNYGMSSSPLLTQGFDQWSR